MKSRKFYTKELSYRGIVIRAHASVSNDALVEARRRLRLMLQSIPTVTNNLKQLGAELHIIGKNQRTSQLPEYMHFHGKPFDGDMDVDDRARGLGGIPASCGEENLLRLETDRYPGRDICVHEFGHTIHMYGLDTNLCRKITAQYKKAIKRGLWKTCYAATNEREYFAELCMWYFGTRGDYGSLPAPAPGAEWLKKYDRAGYNILHKLFNNEYDIAPQALISLRPNSPKIESRTKSTESKIKTIIYFRNHTEQRFKLFWLDYVGKRRYCDTLEPMGFAVRQTFVTHSWLVTNEQNDALMIFHPSERPAVAHIKVT